MNYLSVCSGIEAATVAWEPLGWNALGFAEIEPFPSAVLQHHYPTVPNFGDFTELNRGPKVVSGVDLLVGGTPCQSFSVAGLRGGLDDDRGQLALEFMRLADRTRPRWVLWENVPGVLSKNGGRDFGSILGAMAELGYGWAYRILDAQFFGIPQRRRRVFLVGYLGDWRRAAAVLFERESLLRNPAKGRKARKDVAPGVGAGTPSGGRGPVVHATNADQIAHCLAAHYVKGGDPTTDNYVLAFHPTQDPIFGPVSPALSTTTQGMGVCVTGTVTHTLKAEGFDASEDGTGRGQPIVPAGPMHVRRLTPVECERLQGFPDDYTNVPVKKFRRTRPAADGPRYHALGNSMAVPCMNWIGRRIQLVENL